MIPRPSSSGAPSLGDAVAPSVNVTEHLDKLHLFLDARRFVAMHQDSNRLHFEDARYCERHNTALAAWKRTLLVFDHKDATFVESGEVLFEFSYVCCTDEQ